jgi:hypothetical protein
MAIAFSARVRIAPEVMIREIGGESVLLDLKTERYLGLNESGTRMWQVLMESPTVQTAYETLLAEFDVAPSELQGDLNGLLEQLLANALIVVESR